MKIEIPVYVTNLMKQLNDHGYECFVVGGAIRSTLLGLPVHDYDLTTSAMPQEMKEVFQNYKTIDTGIKHGTVTVLSHHIPVEITTYRKDSDYTDHRHPNAVLFTPNLKEDCARRDFTINALCYNPEEGLFDFFDGQKDLQKHLIRCIGDPYRRFEEDALRILRAIRFAAQLNFTIENQTAYALSQQRQLLTYVSSERIREELNGFFNSEHCVSLLTTFRDVFEVFLPELSTLDSAQWQTLIKHQNLCEPRYLVRLAVLLSCIPDVEPNRILNRLKYSNQESRVVQDLMRNRSASIGSKIEIKQLLKGLKVDFPTFLQYRHAMDCNNDDVSLQYYQEIVENNECYSLSSLAVKGQDMIALGYRGKEISDVLNRLLDLVISEVLPNEKTVLIEHAR